MIDPAVRTQEIKNRWDAVSARLHNIVGQSDLFFADPRKTKTEVLVRRTRAHNTSMILSAVSG
jgi:hypothetical protein